MAGRPQTLSDGQKKEVIHLLWKKIFTVLIIGIPLLTSLTGVGLWQMKCRLEQRLQQKLETLVAKQFEEPRIQAVVSNVAETKADVLLSEQILPEVERLKIEINRQLEDIKQTVAAVETFKTEINKQLEDIRQTVAAIDALKKRSDSTSQQIETVLYSARSSQQEIEKFKSTISGLQSDFVKINRGLVELEYFALNGRNIVPNPYAERINKVMNEIAAIAIPNPQERAKFNQELESYRSEMRKK